MYDDISEIRAFYEALQGRQVAARLRPKVTDFWERSAGCCNIAIGFASYNKRNLLGLFGSFVSVG